jgi:hypothetical protein
VYDDVAGIIRQALHDEVIKWDNMPNFGRACVAENALKTSHSDIQVFVRSAGPSLNGAWVSLDCSSK